LSELLDNVMADEAIDRRFVAARDFEHRFGLRSKPAMVRFRLLDGAMCIGGLSDLTVPVREFACAGLPVERVFITENETNGLTFPPATRSAVVFGLGYGIDIGVTLTRMALRCSIASARSFPTFTPS
jgi:hypothetical protein